MTSDKLCRSNKPGCVRGNLCHCNWPDNSPENRPDLGVAQFAYNKLGLDAYRLPWKRLLIPVKTYNYEALCECGRKDRHIDEGPPLYADPFNRVLLIGYTFVKNGDFEHPFIVYLGQCSECQTIYWGKPE